jgi:hypothetical protein
VDFNIFIPFMAKSESVKPLAVIKYEGEKVREGYMDVRKSGEALIGLDEVIRHFIYEEHPSLINSEFEIPTRVNKGSITVIIPDDPYLWGGIVLGGVAVKTYAGSFLETIAENDAKDLTTKNLCKKALTTAVNVIKLAKHLGTIVKRKFESVAFDQSNELVKVTNELGEDLWIPVDILEQYSNCPQAIFDKMTKLIEEERELYVSVFDGETVVEEVITTKHKNIFVKPDQEEEVVLPELKHGDTVALEGHCTRGNEKSNTIGFLYQGHIITCYPESGNINKYKQILFNNCRVRGIVERQDKHGKINEKRPRIKFYSLSSLDLPNSSLFE